jgi:hypothetical protein
MREPGSLALLKQAATAGGRRDFLAESVERIDKEFGKGYARKHPELVGAYIQTAASDFNEDPA